MSDTSNIGLIHDKDLPKDAIHIAVAQVIAGEDDLENGDPLNWKDGIEGVVYRDLDAIGIVDPFLTSSLNKGDKFYMFLMPNSVTSLTHQWTHPAFNRDGQKEAADKWLKKHSQAYFNDAEDDAFADWEGTNYDRFISEFKAGTVGFYAYGDDFSDHYNQDIGGFRKKFWDNLEIVTGVMATKEQRAQEYFTCSC